MIWLFLKALNLFFIFIFIFSMLVFIITCTRERKASALSLAVSSLFSLLCVLVYVFILRIRLSAAGFSACVIFGCAIGAALGLTASVYRDETGHIMMRNSAWHLFFWAGMFLFTQLTVFFFQENAGTPLFLLAFSSGIILGINGNIFVRYKKLKAAPDVIKKASVCKKCCAPLPEKAKFCPNCGSGVKA